MPNIKEYNVKLNRLKSTKKMTKTMKLVSMSKLYWSQTAERKAKLYAESLTGLIGRLAATSHSTGHPLLTPRPKAARALILVITADRGLCGAFNNNLIREVNAWLKTHRKLYQTIEMSFCGKRGHLAFKQTAAVKTVYQNTIAKPNFASAGKIGAELIAAFSSGEYDEIHLAYNRYVSPLTQTPLFERILPIKKRPFHAGQHGLAVDTIFEPRPNELLDFLIPRYLYFRIYYALLENSAGEHGARMTAMESATKNAETMISRNTLLRNRARQSGITNELLEIIAGAEALAQ